MRNQKGFTLIEIAIVMVIIGLLAGGGISLMKIFTERKARNDTLEYLKTVRMALISYADNYGHLPWADTDNDGQSNNGSAVGMLPYYTLQINPSDAYRRPLRYELSSNLGTSRASSCTALKAGLASRPFVVDADGAAAAFAVAAVLISAGPMDADGNANVFDGLNAGSHTGNNTTGNPNYLRHPPVSNFDDLAIYISGNELFGHLCEYLALAINNNSGSQIYVYEANQGSDVANVNSGNSAMVFVISGSRIEIRSGANGSGSLVSSTPPTPISLAGRGMTLTVP
jgi:prepilin-type N-terminal cleavage/methylation domain-containing protein